MALVDGGSGFYVSLLSALVLRQEPGHHGIAISNDDLRNKGRRWIGVQDVRSLTRANNYKQISPSGSNIK